MLIRSNTIFGLKFFCFWITLLTLASTSVLAAGGFWLVEPSEMTVQTKTEFSGQKENPSELIEKTSLANRQGPSIIVTQPSYLDNLTSPLDILVYFKAGQSGAPPDMSTLRLKRKSWIDVDLTKRIEKFKKDLTLDIKGAQLPEGNHHLELRISDKAGNFSKRNIYVVIDGDM